MADDDVVFADANALGEGQTRGGETRCGTPGGTRGGPIVAPTPSVGPALASGPKAAPSSPPAPVPEKDRARYWHVLECVPQRIGGGARYGTSVSVSEQAVELRVPIGPNGTQTTVVEYKQSEVEEINSTEYEM